MIRHSWIAGTIIASIVCVHFKANANDPPSRKLEIHRGHGLTLNFRPTRETISKTWLDDPSQVTLDFDDANCRVANDKQRCAAQVIHLRRIERLNFPGLPQTPMTTLTVVTNRNIYQFRLTFPNAGVSNRTIVNIDPSFTQSSVRPVSQQQMSRAQIEQGLQVAVSRRFLARSDPLWHRLRLLLQLMNQGVSLTQATQQAGVSLQLIQRLAKLGQANNF